MNFSNKKILFFFPENPFSKRAGNVFRTHTNILQLKSFGCTIDLVGLEEYYKSFGDTTENIDKNFINEIYLLKTKPVKNKLTYTFWKHRLIEYYRQKNIYNAYYTQYLQDQFNEILSKNKYDFIIINYEIWTDLIRNSNLKGAKTIIDTHDWLTLNEFQNNKSIDVGHKFGEEIRNLSFYDYVLTISNDENFIFKNFIGEKVINLPPSLPNNFEESNVSEKQFDLLFVGSDNPFNIEAINWFLAEVKPLLPNEIKIVIIGRVCKHISDDSAIEKLPFVEDLSYYYQRSKIAICPMLRGTGIKIKVVEALSYGLPVVGTEKAIDGFLDKKQNGCLTSNDKEKIAFFITKLLQDAQYYKEVENEAKKYFIDHFSEEKSINSWKTIIEE